MKKHTFGIEARRQRLRILRGELGEPAAVFRRLLGICDDARVKASVPGKVGMKRDAVDRRLNVDQQLLLFRLSGVRKRENLPLPLPDADAIHPRHVGERERLLELHAGNGDANRVRRRRVRRSDNLSGRPQRPLASVVRLLRIGFLRRCRFRSGRPGCCPVSFSQRQLQKRKDPGHSGERQNNGQRSSHRRSPGCTLPNRINLEDRTVDLPDCPGTRSRHPCPEWHSRLCSDAMMPRPILPDA